MSTVIGESDRDEGTGRDTSGEQPPLTPTPRRGCYTVHLACVYRNVCIWWVIKRSLLNPLLDENTCEPLRLMHHLPDSEDGPTWRPWVVALSCSPPANFDAQKAIKACAHHALLHEESHPLEKLRYISILIM